MEPAEDLFVPAATGLPEPAADPVRLIGFLRTSAPDIPAGGRQQELGGGWQPWPLRPIGRTP